ncbi:MAG: GH92 family glycosyl hydrolase [Bacteroidetes bacterium]|nr:GH92 family glycosyl hydrolase [Bacteroidota bacterium]
MKIIKPFPACLTFLLIISLSTSYSQIKTAEPKDPASYVNPFIGTGGHGHTYPGAQVPFGMVQLSPDTRLTGWDGCSAYHYTDSIVYGFSHTHLSGTGCSDYGDILLMPTTGKVSWINTDYSSLFYHSKETAKAGYYSTRLEKYNILAELTATKRVGFHRYTFPAGNQSNIIFDLKHRDEVLESSIQITGRDEIRGFRRSKAWADNQVVYFVVKFSKPFDKSGIVSDDIPATGKTTATGRNLKAFVTFTTAEGEIVLVKVGISPVSIEGALKNLQAEIPGWDFNQIREQAFRDWNKELSKIKVEGGSDDDKTVFYSALYHTMLSPNLYMDVDGSYLGRDFKVHKAVGFDYYSVFSLWDTYRAFHPLFTLIDEKRTNDFINTFIKEYEQGGLLPVWELSSNETFCMIGYHSVSVIADAWSKGIKGFDASKALEAMMHSANTDKYGLPYYRKLGYVPGDQEHESVSKTLEYAYDDWCIAQLAKGLGKKDEYKEFIRRAQSYKNLFDPSTWFMRPRMNGGWYSPFEPSEVNNNYTEANAWQYSFYVPQDLDGFIRLLGGRDKLAARLDEMFNASTETTGRKQDDISGLIGQYAQGNEPSHHMAYLYNYTGKPWKTQEKVHKIMTEMYTNRPDGLIGNEDCGQMSAWFVMSAMGLYQVCPGYPQYVIGTPLFDRVTITQENGKAFAIIAVNRDEKDFYVQSGRLNGQPYNRSYIPHKIIREGGYLELVMGDAPGKKWGATNYDVPRTFITDNPIVPLPSIDAAYKTFSDSMEISMRHVSKDARICYTLDGKDPDSTSTLYTHSFYIRKNITIKAIAYIKGLGTSVIDEASYIKIPGGRSVKLNTQYENQYTAGGSSGLIDGVQGSTNWRLGNWQGYTKNDMDAVVDLGKVQAVEKVTVGFLQDVGAWIWFPPEVIVSVSNDGINFREVAVLMTGVSDKDEKVQIKRLTASVKGEARFIRVRAKNYGKIPSWHPGAGQDSHIFTDEIEVE